MRILAALACIATLAGCAPQAPQVRTVVVSPGRYFLMKAKVLDAPMMQIDAGYDQDCWSMVAEMAKLQGPSDQITGTCSRETVVPPLPVTAVVRFDGFTRNFDVDFPTLAFCQQMIAQAKGTRMVEPCRLK